jgi:hypothetical protein
MRNLVVLFLISIIGLGNSKGQNSQVSLKVGAAKILSAPASSTKGFAYKTFAPHSPYPSLHLEYKKNKFLSDRISLLAGISGIPTFGETGLNEKNIKSGYSRASRISYYSLQPYIGFELSLQRNTRESFRNYFSLLGTIGFNLSAGEELTPELLNDGGITSSGEMFTGSKYTVEQGKLFSPSVQTGARYHITNSKGKEIIVLELQMNYNLTRYFSYTFRYEINGVNKVDYVAEKGFQIQFNVIIPLARFSNRKHQK